MAARFEQAAASGEVLIGEATYALVRESVLVEAVEPLTLKGKSEPVPAYRLVSTLEAPERSHAARFVGASASARRLPRDGTRAEQARCELVTVVGDAGSRQVTVRSGSTRLIDAPSSAAAACRTERGSPYWPVVEVIKQLAVATVRPGGRGRDPLRPGRVRRCDER